MEKRKLTFRQFEVAHLEQILPCLERVLRSHGLDFFILGGLARDIHFLREGYQPRRITKDIDIAVFIPVSSEYERLLEELVTNESFVRTRGNPVRIRHSTGVVVDILPFNEWTSVTEDMVRFGPAFADFNLKGLHEVYQSGTEHIMLDEGHRFRVINFESIILLKILAYYDKPDWRQKDMEDIGLLWRHYFDFHDSEIFDHHNDLFAEERELEAIAGRVIGRKIRQALAINPVLSDHLQSVLVSIINDSPQPAISILCREMKQTPETMRVLLEEMLKGMAEGEIGSS